MKFAYSLVIFSLLTVNAWSQSTLIEGKVVEKSNGQPLIGATVTALKLPDSLIISQAITGPFGTFSLPVPANGTYIVQATYLGYKMSRYATMGVAREKTIRIPDLLLQEDVVSLRSVSISARRPAISQETDRMSIDVSGSVITEGNNVLELLERTPGVSLQGEGNFAINGREGARIMLDGRATYLSGAQLAVMLKGMQARDVHKIEIMSSPSARQDAEGSGGIINVVTKKSLRKTGFTGDLFLLGSHTRRPQYSFGGGLGFQTRNISAFLNASHGYDEEQSSGYNERTFKDGGEIALVTRQWDHNRTDPGRNYSIRTGFEITPDTLNTIGFSVNWIKGRYKSFSTSEQQFLKANNDLLRVARTNTHFDEIYNNLTYTTHYRRRFKGEGHELKITADYAPHGNDYDNGFYTRHFNNLDIPDAIASSRTTVQDLSNTTWSGSIDYLKPLGKHTKLELGWKATYLKIDNSVSNDTLESNTNWIRDKGTSNRFRYGQHVQAGYILYHTQWKKLSVQAGVRGEYTGTLANQVTLHSRFKRNYFDLFPNLFLTYPISERHHGRFSYSRRIMRPGDHDVNVFRSYEDPFSYWEGNAQLNPSKTHVLELSQAYDNRFFTTLSYNSGSDVIKHIVRVGEKMGESLSRPENVGRFVNYGASLMYNTSLSSWWSAASYINVFYNRYTGRFGETILDNSATSWSANTRHNLRLSASTQLESVGYYRSGTASGIQQTAPAYGLDVSLNQSFMQKRLMLKLAGTGVIRNRRPESSSRYENLYSFGYTRPDNRKVVLSVSYKL